MELNGGPPSDFCIHGFPYESYTSANAGRTSFAAVEQTQLDNVLPDPVLLSHNFSNASIQISQH